MGILIFVRKATMSHHSISPDGPADLRRRAASRLTGTAATKTSTASAAEALAVLHALAASPETASDALALLHELQVHQVELELQAQELLESRAELESALRRQVELYDFQPVGCLTLDPRLVVHELNQTAARMLGIARDDACGLGLDAVLRSESVRGLRSAVGGIGAGVPNASCLITLCAKDRPERTVLASIGRDPSADRYLVALTPSGDAPANEAAA